MESSFQGYFTRFVFVVTQLHPRDFKGKTASVRFGHHFGWLVGWLVNQREPGQKEKFDADIPWRDAFPKNSRSRFVLGKISLKCFQYGNGRLMMPSVCSHN